MLTLQEYKSSKDARGLMLKMFEARHVAHVLHLKSKSYSEHEALKSFYDGLLGFLDDFVETYQGKYGLVGDLPLEVESFPDAVSYLEDCAKFFVVGRDALKDHHLQHMVDEVISMTYKTVYKLKHLK
jgi:hypothetical protein